MHLLSIFFFIIPQCYRARIHQKTYLRLCLRVLTRRKECFGASWRIKDFEKRGFWEFFLLHSTKSPIWRNSKVILKDFGGFIWFYKFNICCYNIHKIKSHILTYHSLKNTVTCEKILHFSLYSPPPKTFSFLPFKFPCKISVLICRCNFTFVSDCNSIN